MPKASISLGPLRITFTAAISTSGGPGNPSPRKRGLRVAGALGVAAGALAAVAAVVVVLISLVGGGGGGARAAAFSPVVHRTGRGPTGVLVTFRYRDPTATSVQLTGEWYFSSPAHTSPTTSQGLLPKQWKPGDFAIGYPNGTGAMSDGWPVVKMKEEGTSGVWSYTMPLPSGEFNYGFFVNCPSAVGPNSFATSCPEVSDPSNPPWNVRGGIKVGSVEPVSQVYVPSDRAFHTVDDSWEAPTHPRGTLRDVTYPQNLGASPAPQGFNRLAVYTPPGYDRSRSARYPTLYLAAGGDGNELDWSTLADAGNILDNLIDKHQVKPLVVVMTDYGLQDYCQQDDQIEYDQNLLGTIIPYVQSHYAVAREPTQRAFAGLGCGGDFAGSLLAGHTRDFGDFGMFSPQMPPTARISDAQAKAIKRVGALLGGGKQDPYHSVALQYLGSFQHAGDKISTEFINGGLSWDVWRTLLRDFLTRVAFKPVRG
jgi:enterochelin esterase-like enzyme